jgi:hypothetical protein
MQKLLACTAVSCGILLSTACGDSHYSPAAPTLVSTGGQKPASVNAIQIGGARDASPLAIGETRQLRANALLSDGSEQDITALVEWISANPDVATVTSSGLVTGVGAGDGRIRASYAATAAEWALSVVKASGPDDSPGDSGGGGIPAGDGGGASAGGGGGSSNGSGQGGTGLPPTVQSLTITGEHSVPTGRSIQLHAIAHMSDGSTRDVSSDADWRSDNSLVGAISQGGLLTGIAPGSNVVTANYNGTSASQPVEVTPM